MAFGSFLYVFVDCLRNFLWSRTFISGESQDLGVRTVWKRVMEVGSIILIIYGSNMNIMNSWFSQGYHLRCRWWWWWFQGYVQSHRLKKDVFSKCFLTKLPSDANSGAGRISQDIHMEKQMTCGKKSTHMHQLKQKSQNLSPFLPCRFYKRCETELLATRPFDRRILLDSRLGAEEK